MPSLVDIFRFSSEPKAFSPPRGTKYWKWNCPTTSWKGAFARPFNHRLYFRIADMSTAHKSRDKKPCEPIAKSKPTRGSAKKSTISGQNGTATTYFTGVEAKQNTKSSSLKDSSKKQSNRSNPSGRGKENIDKAQLADTTTYWNEQLQAQLLLHKKEVVERFMAVIEECLDRKLEPFEEPCDGEGCAASSSHGSSKSSAGKKGGSSKRQTLGKRREYQRDDGEDDEGDDNSGGRRNDNNKRSMTVPEKNKLYACPYFKYDPVHFGQTRTCSGPGWQELHRLKEHLSRNHKLPEFVCPRCCEEFGKEDQMKQHLRADEPCPKRQPARTVTRNLADGYNKDQAEQLKKRRTGPCQDKWRSWYCILFYEDENSPNLPSPYNDVPAGSNWSEGHTHRSRYGDYVAFLRRETLNRIRTLFESELDKALRGFRPQIRNNVLARIPSVANSVQRIVQSDPEFSGFSTTGDETSYDIPPSLDPSQLFEPTSFLQSFDAADITQSEAFEFDFLGTQDQDQGQAYQPYTDYSSSYLSDDLNGATQSSDTSIEESFGIGNGKTQSQQPTMVLPQQPDFLFVNDPYPQPHH